MFITPSPKSNGPPLTRKATLEIYTVAPCSQDLPPGCFTTPPGVVSDLPRVQNTPRGVASTPGGGFDAPPDTGPPPGTREALPGGDRCQDASATMSATL